MKKPRCINIIQLDLSKLPLSKVKNQGQPSIIILCPIFEGLGEVDAAKSIGIFVCRDAKKIEEAQKSCNVPILNIQQYWKRNKCTKHQIYETQKQTPTEEPMFKTTLDVCSSVKLSITFIQV